MMLDVLLVKNWRIVVLSLAALAVGFGAAWSIQGVRVNLKEAEIQKKKVEIAAIKKDIKDCQDANKANIETIEKLKDEITLAANVCEKRIKIHIRKADKIRQIDEIKPYVTQTKPTDNGGIKDEKVNSAIVGDALLGELSSMFNNTDAGDKDGIHQTGGSGAARQTAVLSCQVAGSGYTEAVRLYCLDAENAKNLLKNRELDNAYAEELRVALEGLINKREGRHGSTSSP